MIFRFFVAHVTLAVAYVIVFVVLTTNFDGFLRASFEYDVLFLFACGIEKENLELSFEISTVI